MGREAVKRRKTGNKRQQLGMKVAEPTRTNERLAEKALKERTKELDCLYGISRLVERHGIHIDRILKGVASLIPSAWQYPNIACARIVFGEKIFESSKFEETLWKQSAPIKVHGENAGTLEVYYSEEKPHQFEGPFLREERALIDAIAERMSRIIERVQAEEAVKRRLEIEQTISRISSHFLSVSNIDDKIKNSLADLGGLSHASRAYMFLFSDDGTKMSNTHEWCAEGVTPQKDNLKDLSTAMFPWWMENLRRGDAITIDDPSYLPAEAGNERKILLEDQGIKSLLVLPMNSYGRLIGFIGFDHVNRTGEWIDDDLELLKVTSKIICDALNHERMDKKMKDLARFPSENPNPILRLSKEGTIILANKASDTLLQHYGTAVGKSSPKEWSRIAAEALTNRSPRSMEIEIGDRGFSFFIMPVNEEEYVNFYGRDITDRKRVEKELQQYTQNLEEIVQSRTKEIKSLSESVSQRLIQKISQLDGISNVRDRVRQAPDISIALDLILETVLKDLEMDIGAVLVVDAQKNIARLSGFRSRIEGHEVNQTNPLDASFMEFEALEKDKSISRIVTRDDMSLLGTSSVHCAPIHIANKVHGLLAIGGQKSLTLDDSDLTILALYAELTSSVFERQRLSITPAREVAKVTRRRFEVEFGVSYLIKDDVQKAFEIFVDTVLSGVDGLCITREFPPKVRKKQGLEKTPIVWLTEEKTEGHTTVNSLQDVSVLISNFLDKVSKGIVILDGIEYLIMNSGFDSFIRFLQMNRSRFEQHECILLAPLLVGALDTKQVRLIERETISF